MSLADTYTLNDGTKIPIVGFGTWQMPNDNHTIKVVENAINVGYRHIDTATDYGNEEAVGQGIKNSGVSRNELFVTTKLQNRDHTYSLATKAIDRSLKLLNVDYIDLYLIHWPNPIKYRNQWAKGNAESWRAMEEAQKSGKIRTLGVSNFMPHHLEALFETAAVKPTVNQLMLNPSEMQPEALAFNTKHDILSEAYSPLGTGKILELAELKELSEKYEKTVAQVVLRWSLQHGFLPLPKSATLSRAAENADIFDFEIEETDMKLIDSFRGRAGRMWNPDTIDW